MTELDNIEENPSIRRYVERNFDIADRILDILKHKGLTQREFARLLKKNESEISKWLSGVHNFTNKTIAHIETVLEENIIKIDYSWSDKRVVANDVTETLMASHAKAIISTSNSSLWSFSHLMEGAVQFHTQSEIEEDIRYIGLNIPDAQVDCPHCINPTHKSINLESSKVIELVPEY